MEAAREKIIQGQAGFIDELQRVLEADSPEAA
jgi:predicted NUDIX family NTP pyrophosphohydrolase